MKFSLEELVAMESLTWVPSIRRLPEHPTYEELAKHHEVETKVLIGTIQRLAAELLERHEELT